MERKTTLRNLLFCSEAIPFQGQTTNMEWSPFTVIYDVSRDICKSGRKARWRPYLIDEAFDPAAVLEPPMRSHFIFPRGSIRRKVDEHPLLSCFAQQVQTMSPSRFLAKGVAV